MSLKITSIGLDSVLETWSTQQTGLAGTIAWYLENEPSWKPIHEGTYDGSRLDRLAAGQ